MITSVDRDRCPRAVDRPRRDQLGRQPDGPGRPSRTPQWWKKPMPPRRASPAKRSSSKAWCGASRPATPAITGRFGPGRGLGQLQAGQSPARALGAKIASAFLEAAARPQQPKRKSSGTNSERHPAYAEKKAAGDCSGGLFACKSCFRLIAQAAAPLGHRIKCHQCFKQLRQILERDHVGTIGRAELSGILMGLDETLRQCQPRQRRATVSRQIRRSPPDVDPCPPGCCTEWVASKITGAPIVCHDRQMPACRKPACCNRMRRHARSAAHWHCRIR
jgi:hypothetical protein